MKKEYYYIGTELKFLLDIQAEGFDMDRDEFDITIIGCDGSEYRCTAEDVKSDGEAWYLLLDTKKFQPGILYMVVTAYIPDGLFSSGTRKEIAVVKLCTICSYK